jgi:hypothetical protein
MPRAQATPFENIEGALEYVGHLLEACREAKLHVDTEIDSLSAPRLARKKQALQLVKYKLGVLDAHVVASERALHDLRRLRRVFLEERETHVKTATA